MWLSIFVADCHWFCLYYYDEIINKEINKISLRRFDILVNNSFIVQFDSFWYTMVG